MRFIRIFAFCMTLYIVSPLPDKIETKVYATLSKKQIVLYSTLPYHYSLTIFHIIMN